MTTRLAIVGCGQRKASESLPAYALYTGPLFVAARRYVEAGELPWRILSARHGIVRPDAILAPYDQSLEERYDELARGCDGARYRFLAGIAGVLGNWCNGAGWHPNDGPAWTSGPCTIEVHAGAGYVQLVREAVGMWTDAHPSSPRIEVEEPLAGLMLGERLAWYARELGGGQCPTLTT